MSNSIFSTPVLFLIFNRPDTTQQVFNRIREIKPLKLFVSADGPRSGRNEEDKCTAARDIIGQVDWKCEVKTNYSEINLGCKKAVSSGINWFFENVEEGIILEDDCLPDPSFFPFCTELLKRYRNDNRIMHIGGTNFQDGINRGSGSYYFSRLVHVWGWATWKKAWDKYDVDMKSFKEFVEKDVINEIYSDKKQREFWLKTMDMVYSGNKDTWDFQWMYSVLINNGLSIIPNQNLIANIGFHRDATHTTLSGSPFANMNTIKIKSIVHPEFIVSSSSADNYTFKKFVKPGKLKKLLYILRSK